MSTIKFITTLVLCCFIFSTNAYTGSNHIIIQVQEDTIYSLVASGHLSQDDASELNQLGFSTSDKISIEFSRDAKSLSEELQVYATASFDPETPQEGDKRTYTGERTEGRMVYEYTNTDIWVIDSSGLGRWEVYERSQRLIKILPPAEEH